MASDESLNLLIDKASAIAKSDYKLAKVLEIPQQHISNWKAGTRVCSPEDRARLADIANDDGHLEFLRATIKKYEGTTRGEHMKKILKKLWPATGEGISGGLTMMVGAAVLEYGGSDVLRCILC